MIIPEDTDFIEVITSFANKSFTLYPKTTDHLDVIRVVKCAEDEYFFIFSGPYGGVIDLDYFMIILQNENDRLFNHQQQILERLKVWYEYKQPLLDGLRWLQQL